MIESGWVIYIVLAALVYLFWRSVRGLSFDDLLERSAREHDRVSRIITKHPRGGTWSECKRWLQEPSRQLASHARGARVRHK
jgi:hypothetical protein